VLNIFLLVIGMLMEGFSAILVAVPLILPFAARFNLHPFHLAMMFLLNLEIAYCCPPLGMNLFIASFRFERPLVSLYRVVLPFAGILTVGLFAVMYIPKISTTLVDADIDRAYVKAESRKEIPREVWLLQCVQEDRSNPIPCNEADKKRFGKDGTTNPYIEAVPVPTAAPTATGGGDDDDLMKQMMGGGTGTTTGGGNADDDLMKEMMEGTPDAGAKEKPPEKDKPKTDEELFKEMMGN
jgi:C4-dicarboxylate transporter DctM subunit